MPQSDKDLLDWLKFAQSETDGSKHRLFSDEELDRELNEVIRKQACEALEAILIKFPELDRERAKALVSETWGVEIDQLSETIS